MLSIRQNQIDSLGESSLTKFCSRLCDALNREIPEFNEIPRPDAFEFVKDSVVLGGQCELELEFTLTSFVIASALLGPDFLEQHPQAADVLLSDELHEIEKADWLDTFVANQFPDTR